MKTLALSAVALVCFSGIAQACPDPNQWGTEYYQLAGADLYEPFNFSVIAGGDNYVLADRDGFVAAQATGPFACTVWPVVSDQGEGFFTTPPDFTFELWGMRPYELDIRVNSDCDAALLVMTATGQWIYDDDDNGNLDPRVRLTHPSDGYFDVWVGTFDGSACDARLTLETFYR